MNTTINTREEMQALTFSHDLTIDVPASISTQEKSAEQFTASVTLRFHLAPACNGLELFKVACRDKVIAFANANRPKGAAHLRSLNGRTIDVDIVPVNTRQAAVLDEGKAIDVLIAAKRAGKLTPEQEKQLAELFAI